MIGLSQMMKITLKPEDEELIQKRLREGSFESAEEIVHRALETLACQEAWLGKHRDVITAKLERAQAEFDRGEGIPGDEALQRLQSMKKTRMNPKDDRLRSFTRSSQRRLRNLGVRCKRQYHGCR